MHISLINFIHIPYNVTIHFLKKCDIVENVYVLRYDLDNAFWL